MQMFMKKITHEKECDIGTDHQCKVENVRQCRQAPEQVCNTVSKEWALLRVSNNVKLSESVLMKLSMSALQRRLEYATL